MGNVQSLSVTLAPTRGVGTYTGASTGAGLVRYEGRRAVSPTQQQRRAKARARHEAYLARQRTKAQRRRRRQVLVASVAGVAVVAVGGWFLWQGTSDDGSATPTATPTGDPSADAFTYDAAGDTLAKGTTADLVLDTDQGPITIALDTQQAPKNSNSLAFLAGEGYFDGTSCHRLTTEGIYVLQCGDRSGTGSGGPGYTTADENLPKDTKDNYPRGSVAMAEPPGGDAGSQFFLVYRDTTLPPDYTIVGRITSGLEVVESIAKDGVDPGATTPGDGPPATPLTITAARIQENA